MSGGGNWLQLSHLQLTGSRQSLGLRRMSEAVCFKSLYPNSTLKPRVGASAGRSIWLGGCPTLSRSLEQFLQWKYWKHLEHQGDQ